MRVLLLGATGNVGSRLLPALLAHGHDVVLFVRSESKLRLMVSELLLPPAAGSRVRIIAGVDATDVASVKRGIEEHNCDAIVDSAGNQVLPWKEYLLPKIVRAVAEAAVAVGKDRGKPLRAWFFGGMGLLDYPETQYQLQDYMPKFTYEQHRATYAVLSTFPPSQLEWSLMCVALMAPISKIIAPLGDKPRGNQLLVRADVPPGWKDSWLRSIPLVGGFFHLLTCIGSFTTDLEDVADVIAEDLASGEEQFIGKRVGIKRRERID